MAALVASAFVASLMAPLSAVGLALLRLSRSAETPYRELGCLLSVVLLTVALAASHLPVVMGVWDSRGNSKESVLLRRIALVLQSTQVLFGWLAERYVVSKEPLPALHTCLCAICWLGATLVELAGPWPYDDLSAALLNQVAGCDGGYPALFSFFYVPIWMTALTFGCLLLNCVDDAPSAWVEDANSDEGEQPVAHRRCEESTLRVSHRLAVPFLYGLAMSMCGIILATAFGGEGSQVFWAVFGVFLTMISVACAFDWVWRLELPALLLPAKG